MTADVVAFARKHPVMNLDIVHDEAATMAWSATLTADGQTVTEQNVSLDTAVYGVIAQYDALPPIAVA